MEISKPETSDLRSLIDETLQESGLKETDWQARYIKTIVETIRKNPRQYRAFGPYWWVLKSEVIKSGETVFGDATDAEWLERTDYKDTSLNIAAAHVYYETRFALGQQYGATHEVWLADGSDAVNFVSDDPEIEALL